MKTFMSRTKYCKETGFPEYMMVRCCNSKQGPEFSHRTSSAPNAPYIIDVQLFEKKLERGDFREVLEG